MSWVFGGGALLIGGIPYFLAVLIVWMVAVALATRSRRKP
jgi:hypothetical protein